MLPWIAWIVHWFSANIVNVKRWNNCLCNFARCFARLQRENSRNFLVTRFVEEMSYVFSFTFFSLPLIFTLHWWPLAFLILSPPLQNFHVVLPTKKCLLCFLSLALDLCRPFSRWASLACRLLSLFLCLSPALYSKYLWQQEKKKLVHYVLM